MKIRNKSKNNYFLMTILSIIILITGCKSDNSTIKQIKMRNYFLVLDQTLSLDTLDLNDYSRVIDAVFKQVSIDRGDQFAVAFIRNNSLDQREIRFGLKPLKNSRDLPTKKANDMNFQKFRNHM